MTIEKPKLFMHGLWDWKPLDECFGSSRGRVSDIDGVVGHGEVLIIEGKPISRAPLLGSRWMDGRPNGQTRLWGELTQKGLTVIVVYGDAAPAEADAIPPKTPRRMQVWHKYADAPDPVEPSSWPILRDWVASWWQWAEDLLRQPRSRRICLDLWCRLERFDGSGGGEIAALKAIKDILNRCAAGGSRWNPPRSELLLPLVARSAEPDAQSLEEFERLLGLNLK